ncbi:MAG: hypothetical protein HW421_1947 [Ignavibacteria bacterium]|nr:hypothetical protein [Ignavibacteria bacterium]
MKNLFLLVILFLFCFCNSNNPNKWDDKFEVKIQNSKDIMPNDILISISLNQKNLKLIVSMKGLIHYLNFKSKDNFNEFIHDLDSLIEFSKLEKIKFIAFDKISLDYGFKYWISAIDLFKSGKFFIQDTTSQKYFNKIKIHIWGENKDSLNWNNNINVFVDDKIIWETHTEYIK